MVIRSIIKEEYKNELSMIINITAAGSNQQFFKQYL